MNKASSEPKPTYKTPLQRALEKAERCVFQLEPEIEDKRPRGYSRFIGTIAWLQVEAGENNFKMSTTALTDLFDLPGFTASVLRKWAEQDGYVKLVVPHVPGKFSAEFRFDLTRFPTLSVDLPLRGVPLIVLEASKPSFCVAVGMACP
jgi:hypothetical protein